MTLQAWLTNPTCLQGFMVWDCSVCELRCASIIMYGLGLFIVVLTRTTFTTHFIYDVACQVSEPHKPAKFEFHGLVLFGL